MNFVLQTFTQIQFTYSERTSIDTVLLPKSINLVFLCFESCYQTSSSLDQQHFVSCVNFNVPFYVIKITDHAQNDFILVFSYLFISVSRVEMGMLLLLAVLSMKKQRCH
jgi:hypothetical protein